MPAELGMGLEPPVKKEWSDLEPRWVVGCFGTPLPRCFLLGVVGASIRGPLPSSTTRLPSEFLRAGLLAGGGICGEAGSPRRSCSSSTSEISSSSSSTVVARAPAAAEGGDEAEGEGSAGDWSCDWYFSLTCAKYLATTSGPSLGLARAALSMLGKVSGATNELSSLKRGVPSMGVSDLL